MVLSMECGGQGRGSEKKSASIRCPVFPLMQRPGVGLWKPSRCIHRLVQGLILSLFFCSCRVQPLQPALALHYVDVVDPFH